MTIQELKEKLELITRATEEANAEAKACFEAADRGDLDDEKSDEYREAIEKAISDLDNIMDDLKSALR